MIPGEITYTVEQITTTNNTYHMLTYDEILDLIKNWGGGSLHSNKHMLMKTNYAWVYKSVKEITSDLNDYKLLVLPSIQLFDRLTLAKTKSIILQDKYAHFLELLNMVKLKTMTKVQKLINENNEVRINALQKRIMKRYNVTHEQIQEMVDKNIHFIRNICIIQMKANTTLLTLLQGRKSMIRNVIPRKIVSLRSQIFVHPSLNPNQIIFPVAWAHVFDLAPSNLVNLEKSTLIPTECFYKLSTQRILCKRDPAIDIGSVSMHDEVAFAITEMIFVSMAELERKNGDCDGDMESNSITDDILSVHELSLNMSVRNSLLVYNQPRISFTESQILYMHQRNISDDSFPYARIYNFIKTRETRNWLLNEHNRQLLAKTHKIYPQYNIPKYVEPTRHILNMMLLFLPLIYSSRSAMDFYTFINKNVLELANGKKDSPLYDPNLPADYFMKGDIMCESIIRICLSNAKGSLESLFIFAQRVSEIDGSTELTLNVAPINIDNLITQSDAIAQVFANKSRQVTINGHNFFKHNIGYDTINFDKNKFHINNLIMSEDLNFLHPCLLIPPMVAFMLTFLDDICFE